MRPRQSRRRCPLCRDHFDDRDELEACPGCGTDYHAKCLGELGGCSTRGCERRGESAPAPSPGKAEETPEEHPFTRLGAHLGVSAVSQHALKVDVLSRLELTCSMCACLPAILALSLVIDVLTRGVDWRVIVALLIPALLIGWVRSGIDNYYLVDNAGRRVLYNHWFLFRFLRPVASFDRIAGFGVQCKKNTTKRPRPRDWDYTVVMILDNGAKYRLSDEGGQTDAASLANGLAELTGTQAWVGEPEHSMRVRRRQGALEVTHEPRSGWFS